MTTILQTYKQMPKTFLPPDLLNYLIDHSVKQHPVLAQCQQDTLKNPDHRKQIPPEQGQFFELLVKLLRPQKILELGTFTGYSALVFALASEASTQIISCDMNDAYIEKAKQYWQAANVAEKITAKHMKAGECLDQLLEDQAGTFDLIFIDADKRNLIEYYEKSLQLLKPTGLLMVDNVLWHGDVVREQQQFRYTDAVKAFNDHAYQDSRVTISMIPLGDGITLITPKS